MRYFTLQDFNPTGKYKGTGSEWHAKGFKYKVPFLLA